MKLTKSKIDAFEYKGGWDVRWDDDVKGLGLRIYPTGKKSFILRYAKNGKKRTMVVGSYGDWTLQQARDHARSLKVDVDKGGNPLASRKFEKNDPTVSELADRYMEEHAKIHKKQSSAHQDQRYIELHILEPLGAKKISDISRNDISKLHHRMRQTPYRANRVLSLLSKMFNLAEPWGYRQDGTNPTKHVSKYPEKARERFLTADELERLSDVLSKSEKTGTVMASMIALVRLLIFTGARLNEIMSCEWRHLDLPNKRISLQYRYYTQPNKRFYHHGTSPPNKFHSLVYGERSQQR